MIDTTIYVRSKYIVINTEKLKKHLADVSNNAGNKTMRSAIRDGEISSVYARLKHWQNPLSDIHVN